VVLLINDIHSQDRKAARTEPQEELHSEGSIYPGKGNHCQEPQEPQVKFPVVNESSRITPGYRKLPLPGFQDPLWNEFRLAPDQNDRQGLPGFCFCTKHRDASRIPHLIPSPDKPIGSICHGILSRPFLPGENVKDIGIFPLLRFQYTGLFSTAISWKSWHLNTRMANYPWNTTKPGNRSSLSGSGSIPPGSQTNYAIEHPH
jgi:hypothetical protein